MALSYIRKLRDTKAPCPEGRNGLTHQASPFKLTPPHSQVSRRARGAALRRAEGITLAHATGPARRHTVLLGRHVAALHGAPSAEHARVCRRTPARECGGSTVRRAVRPTQNSNHAPRPPSRTHMLSSFDCCVACGRVPVVCVGGAVAGGSGKTPVALSLAARLRSEVRVHFLTRGYGGSAQRPLQVRPDEHDAGLVGDEAMMLAAEAPTWVAAARGAAAAAACASTSPPQL